MSIQAKHLSDAQKIEIKARLHAAERQISPLKYSCELLSAQDLDQAWVLGLESDAPMHANVDAFCNRFNRLQDYISEKLLPTIYLINAEPTIMSSIDRLVLAEKMGLIPSAEVFHATRVHRNRLTHEYLSDALMSLDTLKEALQLTPTLFDIVQNCRQYVLKFKF